MHTIIYSAFDKIEADKRASAYAQAELLRLRSGQRCQRIGYFGGKPHCLSIRGRTLVVADLYVSNIKVSA